MSHPKNTIKEDLAAWREMWPKQRNRPQMWILSRDFKRRILEMMEAAKK